MVQTAETEPIIGLEKDLSLPYLTPELKSDLTRSFTSEFVDPNSWVGIADLGVVKALSDGLRSGFPAEKVGEAQLNLLRVLHDVFGEKMVIVDAGDLRQGIEALMKRSLYQDPSSLAVTFDHMYVPQSPEINVTRIISKEGELLGQGPRPCCPPLEQQVREIHRQYSNVSSVTLVDDVLFSTSTAIRLIEQLRKEGFCVNTMIVGVAKESSIARLKEAKVFTQALVFARDPIIDIVDIRDLVPSVPLGGRVVGHRTENGFEPYSDQNGIYFRIPYLKPGGYPEEWATIPQNHVKGVSVAGWNTSRTIFAALETTLQKPIVLGDLTSATRSAGFPGPPPKHMNGNGLDPNYPLYEVLSHKLRKAMGIKPKGTVYSCPS